MTTRPTKSLVYFHTFHPDVTDEIDTLRAEDQRLAVAETRKQRLTDQSPAKRREEIAARIAELQETVKSGAVRLTLQGLPRGEWRSIMAEHGPRPGDDLDKQLGYNGDTLPDALIQASLLGVTDMNGQPVESRWDDWAEQMTNGQYEEIFRAALTVNTGVTSTFPL